MGAPYKHTCVNTVESGTSAGRGGIASTPTHFVQQLRGRVFSSPSRSSVGSGTAPGQRTTFEK
eukprot:8915350-Heterocapsa_arctica.AAC.1